MKTYPEEIQLLLKTVIDDCDKEDRSVRERQLRTWKRLKLLWEGFTRVWYSETAHDWRVWDASDNSGGDGSDQSSYDKSINVFRSYLESIIAALSIVVPPIKCYPEDAESTLDICTAKAGDKAAKLIDNHNEVNLLWLHSLFIFCTEGMVACYNYTSKDNQFGTYDVQDYKDEDQYHKNTTCSICGHLIDSETVDPTDKKAMTIPDAKDQEEDEFAPGQDDVELHAAMDEGKDICPACMKQMDPNVSIDKVVIARLVGTTKNPKSRVCLEAYGGMNVQVPNYARAQKDCPYLIFSRENHYAMVMEKYRDLPNSKKLLESIASGKTAGSYGQYDQWARLSPQYQGEYPINVVTEKSVWLRPAAFNILTEKEDVDRLRKLFPDGVKVELVNDEYACAEPAALDDYWTLTYNPLSDYVHFDPLGLLLASIQEITNDIVSLTLQTIEHGVGLTFADPSVLNFKAFEQTEVLPGGVFPATAKTGKSIGDGFYETKTAILSGEVLPFLEKTQSFGQQVSGAQPSLWGGGIAGSGDTASQYSMQRAQALQRLQNTWKMFTSWWKNIHGKAIPMYIKLLQEQGDEKDVQMNPKTGGFMNVFIRKAELEGKIGKIELEANEQLPLTWGQKKDVIMQLLANANPLMMQFMNAPENREVIWEAIGLDDLFAPGEDDREKQLEEIKLLAEGQPMPTGDAQAPIMPSVEVDPEFDNHSIHFEICRAWVQSEAGQQAKIDNPNGYRNVLLHAKMHLSLLQPQMEQAAPPTGEGAAPPEKPNQLNTKEAPITGEADVNVVH